MSTFTGVGEVPPMNPTQMRTHNELLAIGHERPYAPAGLVEQLRSRLEQELAPALALWTESSLWMSKGQLFAASGCERLFLHRASGPSDGGVHRATATGTLAHRAIQLSFTHPGRDVFTLVRSSAHPEVNDEAFNAFWADAPEAVQSDILTAATSRVVGFLDSWPRLLPEWTPRFEEPLSVRVGRLTLSGRPDLTMGRPREDFRQTMIVADWKSGALTEDHETEAAFYALLATLRFGVPPFRSLVYSLAAGEWTPPDVDAQMLHRAVDFVVSAVTAWVEMMTEARPATIQPGRGCQWCPLASACEGPALWEAQQPRPGSRPAATSPDVPAAPRNTQEPPRDTAAPAEEPAPAPGDEVWDLS